MKLEIGVPDYPLRHIGEIRGAAIRGRKAGRDIALILVNMPAMTDRHKTLPNVRGLPRIVAFDAKAQRLWLHPLPDGEYQLDIQGAPPEAKSASTLHLPKRG